MSAVIDTLLIDALTPECRLAFLHHSELVDYKVFRPDHGPRSGDVVLGRVKAVVPSIRGAFIDIGDLRDGFLPLPDTSERPSVSEGDAAIVQVRHEAMAEKGARLTTKISLAGRHAVYTPGQPGINISRKAGDTGLAERAAEQAANVVDPGDGAIIRTAALQTGDDGVERALQELAELRDTWIDARAHQSHNKPPLTLITAPGPVLLALQGLDQEQVRRIVIEGAEAYSQAREYLADNEPSLVDALSLYQGSEGLFAAGEIEDRLEALLSTQVDLPTGGLLHIHETPACITVDVDTAGAASRSGKKGKALIRETNEEAAVVLARELRLRNLSGNIVVDFIRDGDREAGRALLETLEQATSGDPVPVKVEGFTRLGMVEVQRRRRGRSLSDSLLVQGGADKTPETLAYEALRRLIHVSLATPGRELTVKAQPAVISLLSTPLKAALDDVKERAGVPVALEPDETMPQGLVDVYS